MANEQFSRRYVGFSTQNSAKTGVSTLYDIDIIKIDLMTAFQTRVGERVMRPDYGCKLWDYLMEPFTNIMRDKIITESIRICSLDERITIFNVQVFELDLGFRIDIDLQYNLSTTVKVDTFSATFENADLVYFGSSPTTNTLLG